MSELIALVIRAREETENKKASNAKAKGENQDTDDGPGLSEGMQCGFKELWAGPEDKHGKFKWLDKLPEDLGKPVEDSESSKFALIVRHARVHNDPRKVLKVHSVVVQSPLLKTLLGSVLKDYPGVTTALQRLTFTGRFEPLIHRWTELRSAVETEKDATAKEHANVLMSVLEKEFKEVIDESVDLREHGVITFNLLWTLFQPDCFVYARIDGQERILRAIQTQYGEDSFGNPVYWVTSQYVDWDGSRFGTGKLNLQISSFTGTVDVTRLRVFPLQMHPQHAALTERLIERGGKAEGFAGIHYKQYNGLGWMKTQFGIDKCNCRERIVIDAASFNKHNPNYAQYVTAFTKSDGRRAVKGLFNLDDDLGQDGDSDVDDDDSDGDCFEEDDADGMPYDGYFPDDDEKDAAARRKPLTNEQKMLCTPIIRGYALTSKLWLNFFVTNVKEIQFNEDAFKSLVLPENQKELILGFTESQNEIKDTFDDVIQGKGRGIILLLCGPPGVGKTLTAESVSEQMRVPLYAMSAGDLGLDPRNIERKLTDTLEMCSDWNAILLLDEADIFLEQRSLHELERNKLVTIFLRILEYYKGIMFLTTNRVQTFDPAFQSRIHISLDYPELSMESRLAIWQNFLSRSTAPHAPAIEEEEEQAIHTPASSLDEAKAEAEAAVSEQPATVSAGIPTKASPKDEDAAPVKRHNPDEHTITDVEMKKLAQVELNGRQIKNTIKTSRLLANRRRQKLSFDHITRVLEVTQSWHNSTRETDKARASIYY